MPTASLGRNRVLIASPSRGRSIDSFSWQEAKCRQLRVARSNEQTASLDRNQSADSSPGRKLSVSVDSPSWQEVNF